MAKSKKAKPEIEDGDESPVVDIVREKKDGKFGLSTFLIPLSALKEEQGVTYESVPSLDIALGGGIPEGSSVLISGSFGTGKTSLCLKYVEECHKKNPDKEVFFFDVEGRLREELVSCYKGINTKKFNIIKSNETKILTAEDYLNLLYSALKDYPHCICILDSIAALCPESENSTNIGDSVKMAGTASLMYKMFRKTGQILSVTKATYIALTHLVANPNPGPGKKKFSVGGNAAQYQASIYLEVPYKTNLTESAEGDIIGHEMDIRVMKSAMGPPGKKAVVPILYGYGISLELDVVNICLDAGVITQSGAWYSMDDGTKFQGKMKIVQYLRDNPDVYERLNDKLRTMTLPNYVSKFATEKEKS